MVGTVGELRATDALLLNGYQRLANVIIVCSLIIAGCSLAVSVAAGLTERKRPFALLRLTGVPVTMLRGVIAVESAVPLLMTATIAIGAGFLTSALFAHAQLHQSLRSPGIGYFIIVLTGLIASLAIISSTFPATRAHQRPGKRTQRLKGRGRLLRHGHRTRVVRGAGRGLSMRIDRSALTCTRDVNR